MVRGVPGYACRLNVSGAQAHIIRGIRWSLRPYFSFLHVGRRIRSGIRRDRPVAVILLLPQPRVPLTDKAVPSFHLHRKLAAIDIKINRTVSITAGSEDVKPLIVALRQMDHLTTGVQSTRGSFGGMLQIEG